MALKDMMSSKRPSDVQAFNFFVRQAQKHTITQKSEGNEAYDADLRPVPCESIEDLLGALIPKLNAPSATIDCFQVLLAAVVGLKINGPFLWMHCVGESSGMKTTLARFIASASDKCFMVSNFNGFYSGYRAANGTDTSLAPMLQNKVLIIPDLTPILQGPKEHQDRIFGEFRDIYEGVGRRIFNNGVDRNYQNLVFGCITCTTDVIRRFGPGRSDIGERFLMSEINASWDKDGRFIPEEINTSTSGAAYDESLATIAAGFDTSQDDISVVMDRLRPERAMCWGLINHLMDWMSDESGNLAKCARNLIEDKQFKAEIESMAIWLEYARCHRPSKSEEDFLYRPALPHRTIKQLTKLVMALCVVNKTTEVTPNIRRLVRKTVFDTCHGTPLEFMNWFAVHPRFSKEDMASAVNRSPTYVSQICHHLQTLGVLQQELRNNGTGRRGRDMLCYDLTERFRTLATTIGLLPGKITAPIPERKRLTDLVGGASNSNGASTKPVLRSLADIRRKAEGH